MLVKFFNSWDTFQITLEINEFLKTPHLEIHDMQYQASTRGQSVFVFYTVIPKEIAEQAKAQAKVILDNLKVPISDNSSHYLK